MRRALQGLEEFKKHLDTIIVVPNQNLFKIANEKTTLEQSFSLSNDVLKHGVQSVTDLMVRPGMINLDFADVETIMSSMGKAMMGTGEFEGDNRAMEAADIALNNPLIDDYSLKGAKGLLVNITGGKDITLFEVDKAINKIRAEVDPEAELIFGAIKDDNMNGKIRVSIVATSLDGKSAYKKEGNNTIFNIFDRSHQKESVSTNLFSNKNLENNSSNTYGANALKIETENEIKNETPLILNETKIDESYLPKKNDLSENKINDHSLNDISIENASYVENNIDNAFLENESIESSEPKMFGDNTTNGDSTEENIEMFNSADEHNEDDLKFLLS